VHGNNFNNFPENQLTKFWAFYDLRCPGMMYPARGGLVWGQMRGVIWSQAGLHPQRGVCITYRPPPSFCYC